MRTGPYTAVRLVEPSDKQPIEDSLHQPLALSRAFGCPLRHDRFGPFFRILPGFTLRAVREGQFYLVFCRLALMSRGLLLTSPFNPSVGGPFGPSAAHAAYYALC